MSKTTEDIDYIDLYLHGTDISNNILTEPLELFYQEIELALQIAPNEVWGISESINLSRYVFNKFVTITQIKNELSNYVVKNCQHASYFPYNFSVEMVNANGKDLIYIICNIIALDPNGHEQTYQQKFLVGY
jgi:hypothetical protein